MQIWRADFTHRKSHHEPSKETGKYRCAPPKSTSDEVTSHHCNNDPWLVRKHLKDAHTEFKEDTREHRHNDRWWGEHQNPFEDSRDANQDDDYGCDEVSTDGIS